MAVAGPAALVRAGTLLHEARGALQISETYGAALLAEEMELACKYLAALRAGKGREDGLDALTRAMVQLPIVHRTPAQWRPRHRAGVVADAQRSARCPRRTVVVRRDTAAITESVAEPQPEQSDGTAEGKWRRPRRCGNSPATEVPACAAWLDQGR